MQTYASDIARLESIVEHIRDIRERTCEPKNNGNQRYHALSMAVSGLMKAVEDMRAEEN